MEAFLPLLLIGVMWALLIRPQQRRLRQHQALVASLEAGDEVLTSGGIYGVIRSVDDDMLALEIAPGVVVRVLRAAVTQRVGPDAESAGASSDDAGAAEPPTTRTGPDGVTSGDDEP